MYNINTSIRWFTPERKLEYYDFKPDLNPKIQVWTRTRPDTKWVTKFPGPQPEFYPKNASIL